MKLKDLLKGVKIKSNNIDLETEIQGIASDSRRVENGYIFVAIKGLNLDGNSFIEDALKNGAGVIITDNEANNGKNTIIVENAREALAFLWNNYYNSPTKNIKIIAITGTNGKTSTAHFLYSIIKSAGYKCGLISTIKSFINDEFFDTSNGSEIQGFSSAMTTPDPETLYRFFYEAEKHNVKYIVMEASSHALALYKLAPIKFYIGAFTNLSAEHLDFHTDINDYFESKLKLFEHSENIVTNIDNEYGLQIGNIYKRAIKISTIGKADYYINNLSFNEQGSCFDVLFNQDKIQIKTDVLGQFTPENILISIACANLLEISEQAIKNAILSCQAIKGRMEKIKENIYIDYAHTPLAMEKAILSIKKHFPDKKIVVLFGCGGNRDKLKRKEMGKIASSLADKVILTSDNCRNESLEGIIGDIKTGITEQSHCKVINDRKKAIIYTVKNLMNDEILLLLGKGHEEYEISNNKKLPFSEKDIIFEALYDKNS